MLTKFRDKISNEVDIETKVDIDKEVPKSVVQGTKNLLNTNCPQSEDISIRQQRHLLSANSLKVNSPKSHRKKRLQISLEKTSLRTTFKPKHRLNSPKVQSSEKPQ